jgi:hypothetical protein
VAPGGDQLVRQRVTVVGNPGDLDPVLTQLVQQPGGARRGVEPNGHPNPRMPGRKRGQHDRDPPPLRRIPQPCVAHHECGEPVAALGVGHVVGDRRADG